MADADEKTLVAILNRYNNSGVQLTSPPKDSMTLKKLAFASASYKLVVADINEIFHNGPDSTLIPFGKIKSSTTYGQIRKLAKLVLSPARLSLIALRNFNKKNSSLDSAPPAGTTIADLLASNPQLDKMLIETINKEYRIPKGKKALPFGQITPLTKFSDLLILIDS